jgi:phage-related protein
MPSVGPRCHELRISDIGATWRILYRLDPDAILILEVFAKKTQKTPVTTISAARKRLSIYDAIK